MLHYFVRLSSFFLPVEHFEKLIMVFTFDFRARRPRLAPDAEPCKFAHLPAAFPAKRKRRKDSRGLCSWEVSYLRPWRKRYSRWCGLGTFRRQLGSVRCTTMGLGFESSLFWIQLFFHKFYIFTIISVFFGIHVFSKKKRQIYERKNLTITWWSEKIENYTQQGRCQSEHVLEAAWWCA